VNPRGVLEGHPLLADLDPVGVEALLARATLWQVRTGEVLMAEGEPGDGLHVLLSGTAEVLGGTGGTGPLLATAGPGSVLGEISFVAGGARTATVRMVSDGVLLYLDEAAAHFLLGAGPAAARVLLSMAEARRRALHRALAARERLAALGTLTAGVAHELGNPVAILLSGIAWLKGPGGGERGDDERRSVLGDMEVAARAIASVVERMRDRTGLARPPGGASVPDSLADALVLLGSPGKVPVALDVPEDLPSVAGDPGILVQLWANLLANARDALAGGGGDPPPIQVRAREEGEWVVVEIEDRGHGIPEAIRERIFEPFFTTRPPGSGSGLGLHLVHTLVEDDLGGRVGVTTRPGRTVFRLDLPVHGGETPGVPRARPPRAADRPGPRPPGDGSPGIRTP
jgi:signal transduction histidine kinase